MRILMLGPHPTIRGPLPKHTPHLVAALRNLGCSVALEPWGRRHDQEKLRDKLMQRGPDILRVRRRLQKERFDVLVVKTAHDWATLSRDIPLLLATRRLCPCIVLQFHGGVPDRLLAPGRPLFKLASGILVRLADAGLLLSSEERQQWQQFYSAGRFFTVSNPFVPPGAAPAQLDRRQLRLPADVPVLLFVGRIMKEKGVLELVSALPTVLAHTACHLHIVGDGPLTQEIRGRLSAAGIADRVTLSGYVEGDALWGVYRTADIFVLPTWTEGFSVSLTEAMAAGLPVVTTGIRGMADHLRDGVHAVFVAPRDPAALADALVRVLADPALRARMRAANTQKVREFSPEIVGCQYLDVLRQIVAPPVQRTTTCAA